MALELVEMQEKKILDQKDTKTNLPIISLYGDQKNQMIII